LTGGSGTPAGGSFAFTTPSTAPGVGTASQSVTYTPLDTANYNPTVGTVSVTVNAPLQANNDTYIIAEDDVLNVPAPGVLENDTGAPLNSLTAILVSSTAHGTLTFNTNGAFRYVPANNFSGIDSFTYKANNGVLDSGLATVTIDVTAISGANDVDLYARGVSFGINWSKANRDRFKIKGKINPRGSKDDLSGATVAISVNGTNLFPAVALDATGHGHAVVGGVKVKVFVSGVTGKYAIGVSGANLRPLLGLSSSNSSGLVPLDVSLIITLANLEVTPISGIFEMPFTTTAGKMSKGNFKFKTNRTLTGVFNVNRTTAAQLKSGQFKISGQGVIENAGGSNVTPTGPARLTIGEDVLMLPGANVKSVLIGTKRIFKFKAASLAHTGLPAAGPGAPTSAHLPITLEIPTATGTNTFDSTIELKRADGTSTKWKR
jgi:hypothetical protein